MHRRSSRLALLTVIALALPVIAPFAAVAKQPAGCTSGTGMVFNPNPVVTSGDTTLTDQKDADYAALNNERVTRAAGRRWTAAAILRGTWAIVVSETGNPAYETDCTFNYTRHDDRFEQVMAYYWVTKSQLYTRSLGFGVTPAGRSSTATSSVSASTSGASTTRSRPIIRRMRCASARAESTMPRTPR